MRTPPPDPQVQAAQARARLDAVRGVRRWVRLARVVLTVGVLLLGAYAWLSYRLYTLPGTADPQARTAQAPVEGVLPGDTLLLQNLNLWREPKLGDLVIYTNPEPRDGAPESLLGRVAGLPGERLERQGPTMAVGGREPLGVGFDLGDGARIRHGDVIPEGCYLILADFDSLPYIDSRNVGYISRGAISRRIVLNISAWQGRRSDTP
ncbi:MAG: hypothetical protein HS108_16255 [Planctomycetes bacterium]|jgi:hypothetical protein|nr:hypothetical protein [Planctomycetota bacterium]MCL4729028.1 hypothetical protein [Planctomycetota bacterium]